MNQLLILVKPELLIETAGLIGVFFVLFAESGLFFGFFLPGDSLLFTAGLLASQGLVSFPALLIISFAGAVLGDNVGYWFGHKVGKKLFEKEDSLLFKKKYLLEAERFYETNGAKTIVLARFIPFVRTFAPIVAGAAHMHYGTFMTYNLIGGFLWAVGLSTLGFFLGNIPIVKHNYEYVIILIIVGSVAPIIIHALKDPERRKQIRNHIHHHVIRKIIPGER
jgi:membrane-associated protein